MDEFKREFLNKIIPLAIEDEEHSKVPAEVTVGQAILESNWGRSKLTINGNNLFGIKADPLWTGKVLYMKGWEVEKGIKRTYDMEWRAYEGWKESVSDHSKFLHKPRYAKAFTFKDWKDFLHAIHLAGYATDPTYAAQIISIIRIYNIEQAIRDSRIANTAKPWVKLYEQKDDFLSANKQNPSLFIKVKDYLKSLIKR